MPTSAFHVGPLTATGADQAQRHQSIQQHVEGRLLQVMGDQSAVELRQDREVEPGIGQVQSQAILPIDAAPDRVSSLPVGEVLGELLAP